MKTLLSVFIFLICFGNVYSQNQDTLEQRIIHLLDISGSKEAFDTAINQIVDIQKGIYNDELGDDFFELLREEMLKAGQEDLNKMIIPIYKKHFTLEEIEGVIEFQESEIGKKMTQKMPLIIAESMQVGATWGEELGEKIVQKIIGSNEYKMNSEPAGCDKVKNGKWKIQMPHSDVHATIERKDDRQIESLNEEDFCNFKIEWLNSCKYSMTVIKCEDKTIEEEMEKHVLLVNIYEVTDTGYKFVSKYKDGDGDIVNGEAINFGKSNSKM